MEIFLLLLLLATFICLVLWAKVPVGLSLAATSIVVGLAAGHFNLGLIEHVVSGMFGYMDVCITLIMAMIFMKVAEKNGMLKALTRDLIIKFGHSPLTILIVITLLIMFPGAITGTCTSSVLSTGILLAPILLELNIPRHVAGAIITMASVFGMVAPPVNVIAMIIGAGMDVPYIGFDSVLLLITVPLAIFSSLFMGYRYVRDANLSAIVEKFKAEKTATSFVIYLPLIVMVILMLGPKLFSQHFPDLGLPLTFAISIALALVTGEKTPVLQSAKQGVSEVMSVLCILAGVGMLIEIMTLTGLRGYIVVNVLSLPSYLLLMGMAISMPLFGGISVFGAASVLGVPFALAVLGKNQILTISALSIIAGMGSFTPPVALTPVVTAQIIGEENYLRIIRPCLVPIAVSIGVSILIIVFAEPIAKMLGM